MSKKVKEKLYTTGDIANMLDTNGTTIYNYVMRGLLVPDVLQPAKSGKMVYRKFKQETVDAFVKSCWKTEPTTEKLLSSGEAAVMLGVTESAVSYLVTTGELQADLVLPPREDGTAGRRKFKKSTIKAFAESHAFRRRSSEHKSPP